MSTVSEEYKTQIFKTPAQWQSGLYCQLQMPENGGITLYPVPTFDRTFKELYKIKHSGSLTVNSCGQLYLVDNQIDTKMNGFPIYRYHPGTKQLDRVSCIENLEPIPDGTQKTGEIIGSFKIILSTLTFWVLDRRNHCILAFAKENFQVKFTIRDLRQPVDITTDRQGNLYVIDKQENDNIHLVIYDKNGILLKKSIDISLESPYLLGTGKGNQVFLVHKDKESTAFNLCRVTKDLACELVGIIALGGHGQLPHDFSPHTMTIDAARTGNIFISDQNKPVIYQLDTNGNLLASLPLPGVTAPIEGIAVDINENLYVCAANGVFFLKSQAIFSKETGIYYSKTLDSGIQGCQWHRLALEGELPPRTVLNVYYYASDDASLKIKIDRCLSPGSLKSTQQKVNEIKKTITSWQGPETNPTDMLFKKARGRYLWLKLELKTLEETARPSINQMKLYYPRMSYLRYLPAIYQEDKTSRDFLERFLSMFETLFLGMETTITQLFTFLDPQTTPGEFLQWLASWLNLALEEEWEEDKKRLLIKEAPHIYKFKGTPASLKMFISIYTGIYTGEIPSIVEHARESKPKISIVEHARENKPMILNNGLYLGLNTLLVQTPVSGFRLGDSAVIGCTALLDQAHTPLDPFLPMAHRFTVYIKLSSADFKRFEAGVRRILEEEKPAHTNYFIRNIGENTGRVDAHHYVGITTIVSDHRPMRLGVDSVLGNGLIAFDNGEKAGKVERQSRVSVDTYLI